MEQDSLESRRDAGNGTFAAELPGGLLTLCFRASVQGSDKPGDCSSFDKPGDCAICYEAFKELEEVKALPCTRSSACPSFYHASCIEKWLIKDPSCPLCRCSFPDLAPAADADVPLIFAFPLVDSPPISNPLRAESHERWLSARELAQRYRAGPSWREAHQVAEPTASLRRAVHRSELAEASAHAGYAHVESLGANRSSRASQLALATVPVSSSDSSRGGEPSLQQQTRRSSGQATEISSAAPSDETRRGPCDQPLLSDTDASFGVQPLRRLGTGRRCETTQGVSLRSIRSLSEVVLQQRGSRGHNESLV